MAGELVETNQLRARVVAPVNPQWLGAVGIAPAGVDLQRPLVGCPAGLRHVR